MNNYNSVFLIFHVIGLLMILIGGPILVFRIAINYFDALKKWKNSEILTDEETKFVLFGNTAILLLCMFMSVVLISLISLILTE